MTCKGKYCDWLKCTFQIAYKQGCEQEQGEYNYPATQTPGYQSQRKLDPLKDVSYKVTYVCKLFFDWGLVALIFFFIDWFF